MEEKICKNCRYWERYKLNPVDIRRYQDQPNKGHCRRYPPTIFINNDLGNPGTLEDDWCGEFSSDL